jgi:hypothetical protein
LRLALRVGTLSAMPKRSSKTGPKKPKPEDENQVAHRVLGAVLANSGELKVVPTPKPKNEAAVTLGRLGGAKGGPARAAKLSPKKRAAIAKKAAKARWGAKSR